MLKFLDDEDRAILLSMIDGQPPYMLEDMVDKNAKHDENMPETHQGVPIYAYREAMAARIWEKAIAPLVSLEVYMTWWDHSVKVGRLAAAMAPKDKKCLYQFAGLFHDIGIFTFIVLFPKEFDLLSMSVNELIEREKELSFPPHSKVSALIVKSWGVSEELSGLIENHHVSGVLHQADMQSHLE